MQFCLRVLSLIASLALCGCGTVTPSFQEYWSTDQGATQQLVANTAARTSCELQKSILQLIDIDKKASRDLHLPRTTGWIENWGVLVTLTMNVIEKTDVTPGLSINQPISSATSVLSGQKISIAQSFSLGLSGEAAATATRNGVVHLFYTVRDLLNQPPGVNCLPSHPTKGFVFVESEIGLKEWLFAAVTPATTGMVVFSSSKDKGPLGQDAISQDFKFQVLTTGGINPAWKLVNVSGNTGSSLLSVSRDRYQDLLVTLGPVDRTLAGKTTLAPSAFALHQAQQFAIFNSSNLLQRN